MSNQNHCILPMLLIAALLLSSCAPFLPMALPTQPPGAVDTIVAMTYAAALTQTAAVLPTTTQILTDTPLPTSTPTHPTGTATQTYTPLPPTETSTQTITPVTGVTSLPPTITPIPTNTTLPPTGTSKPTITPVTGVTPTASITFTAKPVRFWPDWDDGTVVNMPPGSGEGIGTTKIFEILKDAQVVVVRENGVKLRSIPNKAASGKIAPKGTLLVLIGLMNKNKDYSPYWSFVKVKAPDGKLYWVGGSEGESTDPKLCLDFQ